jgi:hypothetical protein
MLNGDQRLSEFLESYRSQCLSLRGLSALSHQSEGNRAFKGHYIRCNRVFEGCSTGISLLSVLGSVFKGLPQIRIPYLLVD